MEYVAIASRCVIGLVFLASATTKLGSRRFDRFARTLKQYAVPPPALRLVAGTVVFVEILISVTILIPPTAVAALCLAIATLAFFTGVLMAAMRRGIRTPCRCFGQSTSPLGAQHIWRNVLLATIASVGIVGSLAGFDTAQHPGGIAVAVAAGATVAGFILILDDVVELFARSSASGSRSAT